MAGAELNSWLRMKPSLASWRIRLHAWFVGGAVVGLSPSYVGPFRVMVAHRTAIGMLYVGNGLQSVVLYSDGTTTNCQYKIWVMLHDYRRKPRVGAGWGQHGSDDGKQGAGGCPRCFFCASKCCLKTTNAPVSVRMGGAE